MISAALIRLMNVGNADRSMRLADLIANLLFKGDLTANLIELGGSKQMTLQYFCTIQTKQTKKHVLLTTSLGEVLLFHFLSVYAVHPKDAVLAR